MTEDQWKVLAKYLKSHYESFRTFLSNKNDIEIWRGYFYKMDYEIGKQAVNTCFVRCDYPPKLSEVQAIYDEIVAEKKKASKQIYEIYREMETYYPMSLRDKDSIDAFKSVLNTVEKEQRINVARKVHNRVIERVKDVEQGKTDNLPVLSECIRECNIDGADRSGNK